MQVTPVTRARLADEIADRLGAYPGRVRVGIDGAPPTRPGELAVQVATLLRTMGRSTLVVAATDFQRPASVRLEFGRTDSDALLDLALDAPALRREVLDPAAPDGSAQALPRLWDATTDRSYRADYVPLAPDVVVLVAGHLLLGRGLPFDLTVHLHMSPAALTRRTSADRHWTLPAYERYTTENDPAAEADLLVLADHPDRPALRR